MKIALVDDHEVVRQGLVAFLSGIEDITVVGQGACAADAVALAKDLKPDILILDMVLPDSTGYQAFLSIKQHNLATKVMFLSSFCEPENTVAAVRAGAAGYLLKDISPKDLIIALRDIYHGKLRLHPDVSALMVNELNRADEVDILTQHGITEREAEVLRLIAEGCTNKDVAARLHISQLTVKTHVSHILDKLKLDDRTQLAIFAIRNNLA